jgi:hypothetical protein
MPTLKIEQDEFNCDPREWDNLGTMVSWHTHYTLGDEQPKMNAGAWMHMKLVEMDLERCDKNGYYTQQWEDFVYDLENDEPSARAKAWKMLSDRWIILPLYLYDHSGLSISTSRNGWPFNCPWDTSTIGWIYVTKEKVRDEYGWKRITSKRHERIVEYLRGEVATYNQYLSGDVWYYVIEDDDGEYLDSLGGLFGYEYAKKEGERALMRYSKYAFFDWLFGLFAQLEEQIEEEINEKVRAMGQVGPVLMYA